MGNFFFKYQDMYCGRHKRHGSICFFLKIIRVTDNEVNIKNSRKKNDIITLWGYTFKFKYKQFFFFYRNRYEIKDLKNAINVKNNSLISNDGLKKWLLKIFNIKLINIFKRTIFFNDLKRESTL